MKSRGFMGPDQGLSAGCRGREERRRKGEKDGNANLKKMAAILAIG